jgi:hypothetical protein
MRVRPGWLALGAAVFMALAVVLPSLERLPRAYAATSATFAVSSGGTHAVNDSFSLTVALSNVTFDSDSPTWVGYDLELGYDPLVLNASAVSPTLCTPSAWGSTSLSPGVVTGCFMPAGSTSTGILETITFTCLADGTTSLHLPAHHAGTVGAGNGLFDAHATDFTMTLVDSTVVCGTGINGPTPTPTTPADTPTATATPNFVGTATISVSAGGDSRGQRCVLGHDQPV